MESGKLYVVFNKWIRNYETNEMPYKIGITKNTVKERFYGLGLKMPGEFETVFAYQFEDSLRAEQIIQGVFDNYRVKGEWFYLDEAKLDLIKSNCETMGGIPVTDEFDDEIQISTESNIESDDSAEDNDDAINDSVKIKGVNVPLHKNENETTQDFIKRLLRLFFDKNLIPDIEINNMLNKDYCINVFGIPYPIIQNDKTKLVDRKGHSRYWKEKIGNYYVCSQWWKQKEKIYKKYFYRWIMKIAEYNT
ncbi:MAG: GIY-YIG nuclease family protein [Treponema sp.]|nr:GIY-YIG nuclease family protein [Treponema sp.]